MLKMHGFLLTKKVNAIKALCCVQARTPNSSYTPPHIAQGPVRDLQSPSNGPKSHAWEPQNDQGGCVGRGPLSDSPQVTSCRKKNKAFISVRKISMDLDLREILLLLGTVLSMICLMRRTFSSAISATCGMEATDSHTDNNLWILAKFSWRCHGFHRWWSRNLNVS